MLRLLHILLQEKFTLGVIAASTIWMATTTQVLSDQHAIEVSPTGNHDQNNALLKGAISVDEAVAEALMSNPGLAELGERARAASAIPLQVGTLADPIVSLGTVNLPVDTFSVSQETPTKAFEFGIRQAIPFPGKLGLREDAALFEAEAAVDNVDELRLTLIRDVKSTWWALYYLDFSLKIVQENQELMREFIKIAQAKYRVGDGLQSDVLLAEVELLRFLDREIRLHNTRRSAEARFNALLDRSAEHVAQLVVPEKVRFQNILSEPTLIERAAKARPSISAANNFINAADKRRELAELDFFPDFSVSMAYAVRSGTNPVSRTDRVDYFSARVDVSVPLYWSSKQSEAVRQRGAEQSQRRFELNRIFANVRREVSTAIAEYQRSLEQVVLLESGIIPQAEQTVAAMRAAYVVNEVDFLNLVSSQITLFENQVQLVLAQSQAKQAQAALEAAVGTEIIDE